MMGLALATALASGCLSVFMAGPALAESLFSQDGNLKPTEDRYTFAGQAGQSITVRMAATGNNPNSPDGPMLDPILTVLDADGNKLAENDDSERTLNSRVVVTLPREGNYTIVARGLSGSGPYKLTIDTATDLDRIMARGEKLMLDGNNTEAERLFTSAIATYATVPELYWNRGDVLMMQNKLRPALADYRKAKELFEKAGKTDRANEIKASIDGLEEMLKSSGTPGPR